MRGITLAKRIGTGGFFVNLKSIISLIACTISALPAAASIISTTGDVTYLPSPPASVQFNQLESNSQVFAFQEQADFTLPSLLPVDATDPGTYSKLSDIPLPSVIPGGTVVNSYYLSADPDLPLLSLGYALFSGSLTFSPGESIVGIEFLEPSLILGELEVGASGTAYPPPPVGFGLELSNLVVLAGNDSFTISGDRRTLSLDWITGGGSDTGGVDQIRIITEVAAVPEPGSIFLLIGGACCLALARIKFSR
jgi:hypothetical protein